MTHKQDKNGNIDGYVKKEHHDKMMKNSDIKINKLQGDLENLKFSLRNEAIKKAELPRSGFSRCRFN